MENDFEDKCEINDRKLRMEESTSELKAHKGTSKYAAVEQRLLKWFKEVRKDGFKVTNELLREKAVEINTELGGNPSFEASVKWMKKFQERYGIHHSPIQDEKDAVDFDAARKFVTDFQVFIETNNYDIENIYNAEDTMINWRNLPHKSLASQNEKSYLKIVEDHLTALVCANAAGTHALPLLIIGKATKPELREKYLRSKPVEYISHKAAWMTSAIFTNWFKENFITSVKQQQERNGVKGKILLIIDNAPSHPSLDELNKIDNDVKVIHLPKNVAAAIQPMNQGVIQKIKNVYRKNLLQSILNSENASLILYKYFKSFDEIKCCAMLGDALASLTSQNLRNAWQKMLSNMEETSSSDNENLLLEINEIFYQIPAFTDYPVESLHRWLNQDKFDPGYCFGDDFNFVSIAEIPLEIQKKNSESESAL